MPDRERLPNRRPSANIRVTWQTEVAEHVFHVTVGYRLPDGAVSEVFYSDGMKSGTDLRNAAEDACVLVSLLLQRGANLDEIGHSLSVVTLFGETRPASVIGAIVDALGSDVRRHAA